MTEQETFMVRFACPTAKAPVFISGVESRLQAAHGRPMVTERKLRTCSGSPACGTRIGAANCPYTKNQ